MTSAVSTTFGSTILLQLSKTVQLKWIFIGVGAYTIMMALFFLVGIKDVYKTKRQLKGIEDDYD